MLKHCVKKNRLLTIQKSDLKYRANAIFFSYLGWDQSEKFVKIYITLKGVHTIPAENVEVTFTEKWVLVIINSFEIVIVIVV